MSNSTAGYFDDLTSQLLDWCIAPSHLKLSPDWHWQN